MDAIIELQGLRVTVDRLEYRFCFEGNTMKPHAFTYYITIHNDTSETIVIKGRKWVITASSGNVQAYEGGGVVGEFPTLKPGQSFHYNSYHLINETSVAEGSYIGQDANGRAVITRIPRFVMEVPKEPTVMQQVA